MEHCLAHPAHGYYVVRPALGRDGDFTTAPEISQVFGELVGLWCAVVWQQMGSPPAVHLIELGPGRGSLMRDALRAARVLAPFRAALRVSLVDIGQQMRTAQQAALAGEPGIAWADDLEDALAQRGPLPAIVIGNEFIDALPVEQAVRAGGTWRRRRVGLSDDGRLTFVAGEPLALPFLPHEPCPDGAIFEWRPQVPDVMARLAGHTAPVAALLIDYGHERSSVGDTLQAVRAHAVADVLADCGLQDLTAQVDFEALAKAAHNAGLVVDGPVTQARFLGALGAVERAARLIAQNAGAAAGIEAGVARLLAVPGMGSRFKAIGLRRRDIPRLPGF